MSRLDYVPIGNKFIFRKHIVSCWIEKTGVGNNYVYVVLSTGEVIETFIESEEYAEDLLDAILGLEPM